MSRPLVEVFSFQLYTPRIVGKYVDMIYVTVSSILQKLQSNPDEVVISKLLNLFQSLTPKYDAAAIAI